MDDRRFDRLAQLLALSGSRRRWFGLLAGVLTGGRVAIVAADDVDGIAVADASSGNENAGNHTTRVRVERPEPTPSPPP